MTLSRMSYLPLIFVACLGMSLSAFATNATITHKNPPTVFSFREFMKLNPRGRAHYITGLRLIARDIGAVQARQRLRYGLPKAKTTWIWDQFLASAEARGSGQICEYAGWIQTFDASTNTCPPPPSCPNQPNKILCRALPPFGTDVCAQPGPSATTECNANAKPADVVAREVAGSPELWEGYTNDVNDFCDGHASALACQTLRNRLTQMKAIAEMPVAAPLPSAASAEVRASDQAEQNDHEARHNPADVQKMQGGSCNTGYLLEEITTPGDVHRDDPSVMSIEDAQSLMCSSDKIDESQNSAIIKARRILAAKIETLSHTRGDEAAYYRDWSQGLLYNLDNCLRDAKLARQNRSQPIKKDINLEIRSESFTLRVEQGVSTTIGYLGRTLNTKGVDLCRLNVLRTGYGTETPRSSAAADIQGTAGEALAIHLPTVARHTGVGESAGHDFSK